MTALEMSHFVYIQIVFGNANSDDDLVYEIYIFLFYVL